MKHSVEMVLEIAMSSIIVTFLIIMIFAGKYNESTGVYDALSKHPYNEISDGVNSKIVSDAVSDAIGDTKSFSLKFNGGTPKTCKLHHDEATDEWSWQNTYVFKELITVLYDGNEYKYIEEENEWYVKNASGTFVKQTGDTPLRFVVYIKDIKNMNNLSVVTRSSIDMYMGEELPTNIYYDDNTDTIACFSSGIYYFEVKLTEVTSATSTTKRMAIPFG